MEFRMWVRRGKAIVGEILSLRQPDARHRLSAKLAAAKLRTIWRLKQLRAGYRAKPIVLIGMVEHLGDIVAAEPIVRRLREEMPGAHLVWAVRRAYRELIDSNPHVDEILPVGCLGEWIWLRGGGAFDRVVDLQLRGRDCPECHMPLHRSDGDPEIHIGNYYFHGNLLALFCRAAGLPVLQEAPRVYVPERTRQRVDTLDLPEAFVVFHCSSNQAERDWDAERWVELAQLLIAEGVTVVEIGTNSAVAESESEVVDLCGRLSILESAEVIRRAAIFVGIDSGPAHLANAVGTPGIILLGHYGPYKRYLPYSGGYADGSYADILYADGPAATHSVARVFAAVEGRLRAVRPLQATEGA